MEHLTAEDIKRVIQALKDPNYDPETMHGVYEGILERYCLYPDPKLAVLIKQLITKIRPTVNFWYS